MSSADTKHRSHLPMSNTNRSRFIAYDARDPDSKFPPIEQLRPPKGAPNVLVILIDDAGFGSASAFGGPCQTPVAERLAANGLKFNRFHTTALCSPTRQALLTGRNHHSTGMGGITEVATGAPGYCSVMSATSPLRRMTLVPTCSPRRSHSRSSSASRTVSRMKRIHSSGDGRRG